MKHATLGAFRPMAIGPLGLGLALLLLLFALPFTGVDEYWIYTATIGFYYALLAASWSLIVGYVGRISFAQAAMAGLGAYASTLAMLHLGLPIAGGIAAAVFATAILGLFIGWLTLRLHGAYLGLTTIGFAEILRITITAEHEITRGSLGLQAPALLEDGSRTAYYYALLFALLLSLALMTFALRSRIGLFLQAIREDEDGAASLGVRVTLWKVLAFAASSAFAGLAGALYAHTIQLISPAMMSLQEMGFVLAMAVIGGFHNIVLAAIGGLALQFALEWLRAIGEWRLVIFGLLAILMLRLAPNGVGGMVIEATTRGRAR